MIAQLERSRVQRFGTEMDARIQQQIKQQIECRVLHYARHPEEIDQHLRELDQEWDLSRRLQANASGVILGSLVLGSLSRFLRPLALIASGFLLMHAIRGWSPPVLALRRLGVRTRDEIEQERIALRALRGDFCNIPRDADVDQKMQCALGAAGIREHVH